VAEDIRGKLGVPFTGPRFEPKDIQSGNATAFVTILDLKYSEDLLTIIGGKQT
jgi:hypothetical protein